jgi:hypothetical protein
MDSQMRTCVQCGALLAPDVAFCQQCGQAVAPVPAGPATPPQVWQPAPFGAAPPPPAPARSGMDPGLRTVLIIIGVACGCVTLVAIIGIVSSIFIPLALKGRNQATQDTAQNTLRAVVTAEFAYYAVHGEYAELSALQPDYLDPALADPGQGMALELTSSGQSFRATISSTDPPFTYSADESGQISGP